MLTKKELLEAKRYSRWESAVEMAEERGLVVVLPREREAFVDIDSEADREHFEVAIAKMAEECGVRHMIRASPSGTPGHYHAIVRVPWWRDPLSAVERIAIQAALGSDRVRETLGLLRLWRDEEQPTLFFERQEVAEEIEAESDAFEAGCEYAEAEIEYDAEHHARSWVRRAPPYAGPWWVWYSDAARTLREGCFEGTVEAVRATLASMGASEVRISCIPHPREPRIGPTSECPSLCVGGARCLGKTSCPMSYACSE